MDKASGFAEVPERELDETFSNCWAITWREHRTPRIRKEDCWFWGETVFQRSLDVRRNPVPTLGSMLIFHHTKRQEGVERVCQVFSSLQGGRVQVELRVDSLPSVASVGAGIPLLNHRPTGVLPSFRFP